MILDWIAGAIGGAFLIEGLRARRERLDLQVLFHLHEHGESYGLQMVEAGLGWRGTIYVRLHRLEEDCLIESRLESSEETPAIRKGYPRRLYKLTRAGVAMLKLVAAQRLAKDEAAR